MWIIGFGTLLYQNSLKHTIGETKDEIEYIPIIINNYKRIFNVYADHYATSHKLSDDDIEMGAANIRFESGFQCNGVMFEASEEDVELLDKRERYYERIEVQVFDYHTKQLIPNTFAYCAKDDFPCIRHLITQLLPNWRDIDYARKGAYAVSNDFGKFYDSSTYLADGSTLLVDHYKQVL